MPYRQVRQRARIWAWVWVCFGVFLLGLFVLSSYHPQAQSFLNEHFPKRLGRFPLNGYHHARWLLGLLVFLAFGRAFSLVWRVAETGRPSNG